jgi:3-phenylpropionate/trans-cinnamate dioxygenase ferredoxin subunit
MSDDNFTDVGVALEFGDRNFVCVEINGVGVVICRVKEELFAVENRCSHALAAFDSGRLRGHRIMCPVHGASFDVRDGSCTGAPASRPIRSFPLRVRDGVTEVDVSSAIL